MKIAILSDLHLEFQDYDLNVDPEILYIIAGDIHSNVDAKHNWLQKTFPEGNVFWINGNHDYYGFDFFPPASQGCKTMLWSDGKDDISLAGATLWTDLSNWEDWYRYKHGLIDLHYIKGLTFDNYNETHQFHKNFLLNSEADIIVSHHCISQRSVAPQFANSEFNRSFYSPLEYDIMNMKHKPKLWIYGHTHWRHAYVMDGIQVICNPRGYPNENKGPYEPVILEI